MYPAQESVYHVTANHCDHDLTDISPPSYSTTCPLGNELLHSQILLKLFLDHPRQNSESAQSVYTVDVVNKDE